MTRRDQIDAVAYAAGITTAQARNALDAVAVLVKIGLLNDEKFTLVGAGTFSVQRRRPRRLRNPATGIMMDLPASAVVKFNAAPDLRNAVNDKHAAVEP